MPWMWRNFRNIFLNDCSRILLGLAQITFFYQLFQVIVDVDPEYKFSSSGSAGFDLSLIWLDVLDVSASDISASVTLELEL